MENIYPKKHQPSTFFSKINIPCANPKNKFSTIKTLYLSSTYLIKWKYCTKKEFRSMLSFLGQNLFYRIASRTILLKKQLQLGSLGRSGHYCHFKCPRCERERLYSSVEVILSKRFHICFTPTWFNPIKEI